MRWFSKSVLALLITCSFAAMANVETKSSLTSEQKQTALNTWQANNLFIIIADGFTNNVIFPAANQNTEIGRLYEKIVDTIYVAATEEKCEFIQDTSRDENGLSTYVTGISGDQCPIYYMKVSAPTGLTVSLKVNSLELRHITDVIEAETQLKAGTNNVNEGTGYFLSKAYGKLPYTLNNYPNAEGFYVATQSVQFPEFTAHLVATLKLGSGLQVEDEVYELNKEVLTRAEVDNYFHTKEAFVQ